MVQGLAARAASGEQVIRPAWILEGPSLPLPEPKTTSQSKGGRKATNGSSLAKQGLLCNAEYVGAESWAALSTGCSA